MVIWRLFDVPLSLWRKGFGYIWQVLCIVCCVIWVDNVTGQARYSILEEMAEGSFVGNIAKDLGLEQNPPNNDWRLNQQGQRPGPSGAGPHPEGAGGVVAGTGPWPNPPTEDEQIQALMAAANEVSEATATLGHRYNAQFPMQHVPDYRQNVYIPGSTATLTANPQQMMSQPALQGPPQAMPQVDVPNAAQTPASKKKSTKKDKK
uniref:Uncharacterized protein n=1 Tax=Oncorhynchus tshawytscha TaxID=74940 RepID=A0AAZ3SA50_ONCTS